jgi:hypothetical protein
MIDIRTPRRARRWSRLVAAPVGVVALVGLAAGGTSTDTGTSAASSGGTPTSAPSAAQGAAGGPSDSAMAAYTSCLAENGVTLPERPARGSGAQQGGTPPSGAPTAGDGGPGGGPGGPGAGGGPGTAPEGVDADTWAAAQQACADLAPTPPDGGGPAASSGT